MISERASRWIADSPFLVEAHFACAVSPYDPEIRPGGYVNFGTAENHLVFDLAEPLLAEAAALRESDAHYHELHGAAHFRRAIAAFLSRRGDRELSPEHIVTASGASAILEILSFVLCDPGDAILTPAPYYSGFDHDLALRSGAALRAVPLASPDFRLTIDAIEKRRTEVERSCQRLRALLLSSPQNPLGQVIDEERLGALIDWAERRQIHLIFDEIYAESLMPGVAHVSALSRPSKWVHVVYGFAKDFGLSGFKVGILHSEHPEVVRAAQACAYFHAVSTQTQRTLTGLLASARLDAFLRAMRERLRASHARTVAELAGYGVTVLPIQGGIVLWLDLRRFLASTSFAAERELFQAMLTDSRVSLPPGQSFHCSEPGWFRLCFTIPEPRRAEGLRRIGAHLGRLR